MRRRVTFSRNVTLSLSRTCRCYCKYCAFATHRPHLQEPDEVVALLDGARSGAASRSCSSSPARRPTTIRASAQQLAELGLRGLRRLRRVGVRAGARARAPAAHEPRRARRATTSAGCARSPRRRGSCSSRSARPRRPPGLADEAPGRAARRRSAPRASCGSRSRAGSSSGSARREEDRIASLEALAAVHAEYGHLQEVILQNFVPHRRYYGEEPAEIATEAAEAFWRTGLHDGPGPRRAGRGRRR